MFAVQKKRRAMSSSNVAQPDELETEDRAQVDLLSIAHELSEGMQAVTNYVEVARQISTSGNSTKRLAEVLNQTMEQIVRVNKGIGNLHRCLE